MKIKILILIVLSLVSATSSARAFVAENSAEIKTEKTNNTDTRIITLVSYLKKRNSPLINQAEKFICEADKNSLDWRLIPAIAGVESNFGKRIPYNSYNAYGWANGNFYFRSWENSIEIVSETLKTKYIDKGAIKINQIAKIYAPPSSTWVGKVKYFTNQIDPTGLAFDIN